MAQKTAQQLIPLADKFYSRYVRLKDASYTGLKWVGECISCPRQLTVIDQEGKWIASSQNGHYVSRGKFITRYDDLNCNLQCAHCNAWRDKQDMIQAYRAKLADKIGLDEVKNLEKLAKSPDAYKRTKKPELLEIIRSSKEYIAYALDNPDKYID